MKYVLFSILFLACNSPKNNKTEALLPKKMQSVFIDLLSIKTYNDTALLKINNKDSVYHIQLQSILQKHKISTNDFRIAYDYLLEHGDSLKQFFVGIKEQLR